MPDASVPVDPATGASTAAEVAAAIARHPAVAALDAGPFGTIASHLPGRRRVLGVRIGAGGSPVELSVIGRMDAPLLRLGDELAAIVRGLLGPVEVEVTIADVVEPGPAVGRPPRAGDTP